MTPGVTVTRLLLGLVLLLSVLGLPGVSHAGYAEGNMFDAGITNTTPAAGAYGLVVRPIGGSGGGDSAIVDGATASVKATVKDFANSNPLAIIPVDTNGDPASLSGGTQYDQGTAAADTDKLTLMGCVRADTAAAATGVANLDRARCIVDSANRLWVRPTGNVSPGAAFANPTDAITAWSLNGCWNGSTWDPCLKGSAGAGAVDSTTARVTLASDDPSFVGTSNDHYVSVGTTEDEHQVKATAGRLIAIQVSNSAATVAYLRCANLTAANTTPGTSPVFWGMAVPGATTGAGITANFGPTGIAFSTALTCWVVTGKAESDVAEVGANDVQWNVQYK